MWSVDFYGNRPKTGDLYEDRTDTYIYIYIHTYIYIHVYVSFLQTLYHHGEGKLGRDEDIFIDMFTDRPYAHLRLVFQEYEKATDRTIEDAIDSQFSGAICMGLLTLGLLPIGMW